MMQRVAAKQSGFALIAAIFLMVVLAAVGAFALTLNQAQLRGNDLQLMQQRADAAARAGVDYTAARLAASPTCTGFPHTFAVAHGFTVWVGGCADTPATSMRVFTVEVRATRGAYGSPEFAARRLQNVRIAI